MKSSHSVLRRPITLTERQLLSSQQSYFVSYIVVVVLSAGPVWGLGTLAGWGGSMISSEFGSFGRYLGWGAGTTVTAWTLVCFYRFQRRESRLHLQDLEEAIVEEYTVTTCLVATLNTFGNRMPNLACDIGGKVLVLSGQWLTDPTIYGVARDEQSHEFNATLNGLPEPVCFPNSTFVLVRAPSSGRVLSILPSGEYIAPGTHLSVVEKKHTLRDSELFECNLHDLRLPLL